MLERILKGKYLLVLFFFSVTWISPYSFKGLDKSRLGLVVVPPNKYISRKSNLYSHPYRDIVVFKPLNQHFVDKYPLVQVHLTSFSIKRELSNIIPPTFHNPLYV